MQHKHIRVSWDGESESLHDALADGDGDIVPTQDGKAQVKIDQHGDVIGFQLTGVSKHEKEASLLIVTLTPAGKTPSRP